MIHHGSESYAVASSAAAKKGREKFQQIIHKGRASALAVAAQVQSQIPVDRISPAKKVQVVPVRNTDGRFDGRLNLVLPGVDDQAIHPHALGQIAEKSRVPSKYLRELLDSGKEWAGELAARNVNEQFAHADSRHLIRSVKAGGGEEVRGFVSDKFRRLDSRPLLDAFMGGCAEFGLVPIEGYALDTKVLMRAVIPHVFEPIDNEVMLFGLQWGNSDFGNGGHTVALWNMRVFCTNTATLDEALRQVHVGKRLEDNIEYSQKTYELDTKANASALKDVVRSVVAPAKINAYLEDVRAAAAETVGEKDVLKILKARLGKGEGEAVKALFDGPDVLNLPPEKSSYRLSNAISFFAQSADVSPERRLDLQKVAGDLLHKDSRVEVIEV